MNQKAIRSIVIPKNKALIFTGETNVSCEIAPDAQIIISLPSASFVGKEK